jgi:prephenate dehydratase
MEDEPTFDLDAAGLRADGPELVAGVEVLARKLEISLPQSCVVRRRRARLFSKDRAVAAIVVTLGTTRYGLEVHGDHVHADRRQEVRGVVIKREPLEVADWIDALAAQLREEAADSAEARAALEKLVG